MMKNIKNIFKDKKGMSLTIKSLFAIFLVIFVFFIMFSVIKSRVSKTKTREHFSSYELNNQYFLTFLSNPNCISIGNYQNTNRYSAIQGVIEAEKLQSFDQKNSDLWCVENFDFLYTFEVEDTSAGNQWLLGLTAINPEWAERKLQTSLPCAIRYKGGIVNPGIIYLYTYYGEIPGFYGKIKKSCVSQKDLKFNLESQYKISYNNTKNLFCIDKSCFKPYFSCKVESFTIPKGKNLIYIESKLNEVNIIL